MSSWDTALTGADTERGGGRSKAIGEGVREHIRLIVRTSPRRLEHRGLLPLEPV
jgi:hypothetical protein